MSGPAAGERRLVLDGFHELGGLHCETSVVRKVLAYRGVHHSEETLLGLGGGIGFIYWWRKDMPAPLVGGRNGGYKTFIATLAELVRQEMELVTTRSPRRAYEMLLAQLAAGTPAICYVDVFHLPYLHAGGHFGGHAIVVYGVDEREGVALVSDRSARPLRLGLDDLQRARSSPHQPVPPHSRLLEIAVDPAREPGREDFLEAVRRCVTAMTRPPIANLGLRGFEVFRRAAAEWVADASPGDLVSLLGGVFLNIEIAGTGGCAFRRMYRRFLAENAAALDHPDLPEAIARLDDAIAGWESLVRAVLPEEVPALWALQEHMRARNRAFEQGDLAGLEPEGEEAAHLRARAVAAVERGRDALRPLPERIADVGAREARLFAVLERIAPPAGRAGR
jgi:hypothetical protein